MATVRSSIRVSVEPKRWFAVAFSVAAYACALISLVSPRWADWLSDKLCTWLARYGHTFRSELA